MLTPRELLLVFNIIYFRFSSILFDLVFDLGAVHMEVSWPG